MNAQIKNVAQLPKVNICNKKNQQMEQVYNKGEEMINILIYVDIEKQFNIIQFFPELNQNVVKKGVTFTLPYTSRTIK